MDEKKLKEKLLSTGQFIDNKYLDQYCGLIINNLDQKKIKCQTQNHHIIPKCYFQYFNLPIDESSTNKVNLYYKDHIIAHKYLALFSIVEEIKISNSIAFFTMCGQKLDFNVFDVEEEQLQDLQELYQNFCEYKRNQKLGSKLSEETKFKKSKAMTGRKASPETKEKMSKSQIGLKKPSTSIKKKGKKQSAETVAKRASKLKGRPRSQEFKNLISKANKGKEYSQKTKNLISQSKLGVKQSKKTRELKSQIFSNFIWVHKGNEETRVFQDQLQIYLDTGWVLGRGRMKDFPPFQDVFLYYIIQNHKYSETINHFHMGGAEFGAMCKEYGINKKKLSPFISLLNDEYAKYSEKLGSQEKGLEKIIKMHSELTPEAIINTLLHGAELKIS